MRSLKWSSGEYETVCGKGWVHILPPSPNTSWKCGGIMLLLGEALSTLWFGTSD